SQYPIATPSSANGTQPASSAAQRESQPRPGGAAGVAAAAAATTPPAAASEKQRADSVRPANRATAPADSVRRKACHGDARSAAIPTPNWKNAIPSTAKPANAAILASGSWPGCGTTKKRKNIVGKN